MGTALGYPCFADSRSASGARPALPPKDFEPVAVAAPLATTEAETAEGGSLTLDTAAQQPPDGPVQCLYFVSGYTVGHGLGMYPGGK